MRTRTATEPSSGWLLVAPWSVARSSGVNHVIVQLARNLPRASRYRPVLLVPEWSARTPESAAADAEVARCDALRMRLRRPWDADTPLRAAFGYTAWLLRRIPGLWRLIRRHRIQVVNVHYPSLAALTFVLLRWLPGVDYRLLLSFHGADLEAAGHSIGGEKLLWRILVRNADVLVACSWAFGQAIETTLAPGKTPIVGIHNGIDANQAPVPDRPFRRPDKQDDSAAQLVSVGTFTRHKGHDVLLRAIEHLVHRDGRRIRLDMLGARGEAVEGLHTLIGQHGLDEIVSLRVACPHHEVLEAMAGADVFVLPSRREPFGLVVLEAGCSGLPVVASRVGGIPEIIEDGVHGRLVPPDDDSALAAAIAEMLDHPDRAAAFAAALKRRTLSEFSWTRAAERYAALVDKGPAAFPAGSPEHARGAPRRGSTDPR